MGLTQLQAEAAKLSLEDRLLLMNAIWESMVAASEKLPVSRAHREVLESRLLDLEQNPEDESSWEEVRARMESRSRTRQ